MAGPEKISRTVRAPVPVVLGIVLISCVIATGCLDTVVFPLFTSSGHTHRAENEGKLSVYFLDVGQGDSTLFVLDGKTILIDAGEIDMGDRVVGDLKALGVTRIDLLVATHPHSDHIGGMQEVLATFPVGQVLDAGLPYPSPVYEHFLETIDRKNIPYKAVLPRVRPLRWTRHSGSWCSRHPHTQPVTIRMRIQSYSAFPMVPSTS